MGDYRHNPLYTEDINTHLLFTVWRYPCIQEVAGGGEVCALGKASWKYWGCCMSSLGISEVLYDKGKCHFTGN